MQPEINTQRPGGIGVNLSKILAGSRVEPLTGEEILAMWFGTAHNRKNWFTLQLLGSKDFANFQVKFYGNFFP